MREVIHSPDIKVQYRGEHDGSSPSVEPIIDLLKMFDEITVSDFNTRAENIMGSWLVGAIKNTDGESKLNADKQSVIEIYPYLGAASISTVIKLVGYQTHNTKDVTEREGRAAEPFIAFNTFFKTELKGNSGLVVSIERDIDDTTNEGVFIPDIVVPSLVIGTFVRTK